MYPSPQIHSSETIDILLPNNRSEINQPIKKRLIKLKLQIYKQSRSSRSESVIRINIFFIIFRYQVPETPKDKRVRNTCQINVKMILKAIRCVGH